MNSKKYYHVEAKADEADILIYGEIGDSWFEESVTARQFVVDVKDLEKKVSKINVRINSPGGSVFDGLAIFNALQNSTAEVHTWNDGLAASMAAMVLMAGKTVHASKNSLLMIHSPSTYASGNAKDFRQALDALDKVQNSLIECLLPRTQKTRAEIEAQYFDYTDHWLSADEAKAEGFIDDVIEKEASVNQKVAAKEVQEMFAHMSEPIPKESGFMKLVATLKNIFTPEKKDSISNDDMDIKTIQAALALSDTATETDVLDSIKKMGTDLSAARADHGAEKAAKDSALKALAEEKAAKALVEKEFEDFKKSAGAVSAALDPDLGKDVDTDPQNFGEAFVSVMKIFKKK
jgi:ATP-dependent Clp endopeptidase proteolytic subunit ClpP